MNPTTPGEAALSYADRGWQVFPLHGIQDGHCTCGKAECESPGKHPKTARGFHDATTDDAKIRAWWQKWPAANVGVRTGAESGIFALDVDSREAAEALKAEGRLIPEGALIQETGRGWQVIFRHPGFKVKNSSGELAPACDVRGDGGYIVAPPSRHVNGKVYTWKAGEDPGEAPEWLLALMRQNGTRPTEPKETPAPKMETSGSRARAYVTAALEDEWGKVRQAPKGTRNATLNRAAFALGQLASVGLSGDEAHLALVSAATAAGLSEEEAERTFKSGYQDGMENPRELPDRDPGKPEQPERIPKTPPEDSALVVQAEPVQVFYSAPDLRDYVSPHIAWLIEKLLAKGIFTIFGGKPKSGKTTWLFGAVYAMLMGVPFMGLETHKARILYITEQNKTTIRPKLDEYGLLDSADLHLMFPRQMLGLTWEEIIDQAASYCEDHSIDVVIVDTVNDLCHLENSFSDTEWIDALNPLQRLAQHGGMAVCASLHAKKEAAVLVDMFRGSNAIVGKADIVLGLWREGSGDETTRTVEGMSRLDNGFDERTRIVREGREYLTAGTVKEMELEARLQEYLDALPTDRDAAMTRQEIAATLDVTIGTVTTHITKLIAAGKARYETRPGRGNTRIYWATGGDV